MSKCHIVGNHMLRLNYGNLNLTGDLVEQEQLPEKEIHYLYKDIKELEE